MVLLLPRPAYQPKYGPIEYKICDLIQNIIYKSQRQMSIDEMEQSIVQSSTKIGSFDITFDHCGYSRDGNYNI